MKNVLSIDMTNGHRVDLVSRSDEGVNEFYLKLKCDLSKSPTIEIGVMEVIPTTPTIEYTVPSSMWVGGGQLQIVTTDDDMSRTFTVNQISSNEGNISLEQLTETTYEMRKYQPQGGGSDVTITPTLTEGVKIADYSIDGVSGELFAPKSGVVWTETNTDYRVVDYEVITE